MIKTVKVKRSIVDRVAKKLERALRHLSVHALEGVMICDFNGVKVALDFSERSHLAIYRSGGFEIELTKVLCTVCNVDDIIVDIGANVGWHTLSLLVKRPDIAACYAYEPSMKDFDLLNLGIRANNVQNRCFPQRIGLGSVNKKVTLKHFDGLGSLHSSLYPLADYYYQEEEVQIETLDDLAYKTPVSIVKCDVEGSERDVLLGAKRLLAGELGQPPLWFLEANYETAGMAGFFPWELIDIASQFAPYHGYFIRRNQIVPLPSRTSLRHGDMLVLAIPELHQERLNRTHFHNHS
jgi:FkbM family methyltransferase